MASKVFKLVALSSTVAAQDLRTSHIAPEKGPSAGHTHGLLHKHFDDWNDHGFNGGVYSVCAQNSLSPIYDYIVNVGLSYAGNVVGHGPWPWHDCFDLLNGENIVELHLGVGHMGLTFESGISGIQYVTNTGRSSPWYGGRGSNKTKFVAPKGKHLVALYGIAGAYGVNKLGVYWGVGGGIGQWTPVLNCPGCGPKDFKYSTCSTKSGSSSKSTTKAWQVSVPGEMAGSFSAILGLIHGQFFMHLISGYYSHSVVDSSKQAFETTDCQEMSFSCNHSNLFQWTFTSNFDLKGEIKTATKYLVCTDVDQPCCLPGTFSNDPTKCDQMPDAPNGCGKPRTWTTTTNTTTTTTTTTNTTTIDAEPLVV